ncbi:MAG: hypothetical protein LBC58_01275 [Clostridiales Family XIII bacterium]|jgi:ABC-type sulfate transport system permease component|nr:hypothetical protein [Clostridiales Family XIII bacterium]
MRTAALSVCVLFIAATLFSTMYISSNLNHTHNQHGPKGCCSTCMHMQQAANLSKTLTVAAAIAVLCGLSGVLFTLKPAYSRFDFSTLITCKVRLNY